MASWDAEVAAATLSGVTTLAAFQFVAGGDFIITADAGELVDIMVKANTEGTDDVIVRVWSSNLDAPGEVPNAGAAVETTLWGVYQAITISDADQDNEWIPILLSGHKKYAVSLERVGSTDTPDCDMYVSADGVSA